MESEIGNYATALHPTPYTCDLQLKKVIQTVKNAEKLFKWFNNNFVKPNPELCHFLTNDSKKNGNKYYIGENLE